MRSAINAVARALIGSLLWTVAYPAVFPWVAKAEIPAPPASLNDLVAQERVELTQFRTEHAKRFQNPDGTITDEVSLAPIHYQDTRTGKMEAIDMSLAPTGEDIFTYATRAGRLKGYLATDLTGPEWLRLTLDEQYDVRLRPVELKRSTATISSTHANFADIAEDTDVDWSFAPDRAMGTVTLRSNSATQRPLRLTLWAKGLDERLEEDGSIGLYDSDGIRRFTIPVPTGKDVSGKSVQGQIRMQTTATETTLEFSVYPNLVSAVASADPLVAAAGADYPVTFPVIIFADQETSRDAHVAEFPQSDDFYGAYRLKVGSDKESGTTRSLLWFPLPTVPAGKYVTDATLIMQADSVDTSPNFPTKIDVFRAVTAWTSPGVTWANQPSMGATAEGTTIVDQDGKFKWNVSGLVYDWYHNSVPNDGMVLKARDEGATGKDAISFRSSDYGWVDGQPDYSQQSSWPLLSITYADQIKALGTQPYWSYAGNVNMANGNLVLSGVDTAIPGRGLTATITRTYNSRSTFAGSFGFGWTSEVDRQLVLNLADTDQLAYVEPDGSVHHFVKAADGIYYGPEGLFLKVKPETNGQYTLSPLTGYPKYLFDTDGRILSITDVNQNQLTYTWSASLITVTDPGGREVKLALDAQSRVETLTDIAGGITTYHYSSSGDLDRVTYGGKSAYYRYDGSHNLVQITSTGGTSSHFIYNGQDKVISAAPVNQIPNAGMEVNGDTVALPDYWSVTSSGESYATSVQSSGLDGAHGKYLSTYLTPPTDTTAAWGAYLSEPLVLDGAKRYVLSGRYQSSETTGGTGSTPVKMVLSVYAYDSTGTYIDECFRQEESGAHVTWATMISAFDASALPANTATIRVKVAGSKVGKTATILWDDVQLEEVATEVSTPSTFVSPTTYNWDPSTLLSAVYDGNGKKVKYESNRWGNPTKVTIDPDGLNAVTTYDWVSPYLNGQLLNPVGGQISREYDADGNVLSVKQGMAGDLDKFGETSYGYDSANMLEWLKSGQSADQTSFSYTQEQSTTVKTPLGIATGAIYRDLVTCKGCTQSETPNMSIEPNLLVNFNFDRWTTPEPTDWTWNGLGSIRANNGTEKAHVGTKALAITPPASTYVDLWQEVPIKAETFYTLSLYTWGDTDAAAGQGGGVVSFYDDANNLLTNDDGITYHWSNREAKAGAWNRLLVTAKSPKTAVRARIAVYGTGVATPGTVLIDSVQFEEAAYISEFNLVENAGLEQESAGVPDQWVAFGNGTWSTVAGFAGAKAKELKGSTVGWSGLVQKDWTPYDPAKPLTLTAVVATEKLTNGEVQLKLEWGDSAGTHKLNTFAAQTLRGTNGWTRLFVEVVPNSVKIDGVDPTYVRVSVLVDVETAMTEPWSVKFDSIRLEQNKVATSYAYDSTSGQVTTVTNPRGETFAYSYDSYGRMVTLRPNGNVDLGVTNTWDALGRLQQVDAPVGLTSLQEYDDENRLTKITRKDACRGSHYLNPLRSH